MGNRGTGKVERGTFPTSDLRPPISDPRPPYFVRVMMNVAIEMSVPTDDRPNDSAGGTFHDWRARELLGST